MTQTITRGFVDVPEGQCHVRVCGSQSDPFLVMFHGNPGSSFSLTPLMPYLAKGRRVIAFDIFGNGDSSPCLVENPEIGDLAMALMRAMDTLDIESFDLYGYHTGTSICTEIAIARPDQVRRIVLEGVSVFSASDQEDLLNNDHAPDLPPDLSGSQFVKAWTMVRDAHLFWPWWDRRAETRRPLGLPPAEYLTLETIEVLKSSRTYFKSYQAALRYPKRNRLPLITKPTLIAARPSDQLFPFVQEAARLVPGAATCVLPDLNSEDYGALTAEYMLDFLDAG